MKKNIFEIYIIFPNTFRGWVGVDPLPQGAGGCILRLDKGKNPSCSLCLFVFSRCEQDGPLCGYFLL